MQLSKTTIFFLLAVVLTAQDTQRTATFSSNTNLVVIDVYARDQSGKPITTLTKDDFIILEDGKPQAISVFELQHLDTELLPPIEDAPRTLVDRTKPAPPRAPQTPPVPTPSGSIRFQ